MENYHNPKSSRSNCILLDKPTDSDISTQDPKECNSNVESTKVPSSEDEEGDSVVTKRLRKHVQRFSDSDESDKENVKNIENVVECNDTVPVNEFNMQGDSDSEEGISILKTTVTKSRIKNVSKSSDSSDSEPGVIKREEQKLRVKNKRNKLKDKFRSLVTSRGMDSESFKPINSHGQGDTSDDNQSRESSTGSHDEISSIEQIKKKIKSKALTYKSTICDPDTSDEENNIQKKCLPQKKAVRSMKITSPKPLRMTAKQAMENMKKIKSESNRMLREKEVSLPYHRPKALSLKDIMSRRNPAISSDGKSLPIKMNEEQLKQYAQFLDERQKEMIELCKSDTEEEEEQENSITDKEEEKDRFDGIDDKIKDNLTGNIEMENNIELMHNTIVTETSADKSAADKSTEADTLYKSVDEKYENMSNTEINLVCNNTINDKFENTSNTDMNLVYNSTEEPILLTPNIDKIDDTKSNIEVKSGTEIDTQLMSLYYDTEKSVVEDNTLRDGNEPRPSTSNTNSVLENVQTLDENKMDDFSDDDINLEEIDNLIENAEIFKGENCVSSILVKDSPSLNIKPKLTGVPGMVIDLDGISAPSRKLTGVELLKERFTYFAKLKTPEELERENEKRIKPGTQHLKLKQELEDKIAEQRSLEWAKRLEQEKQQQLELDAIRGDHSDDDIEKIEAMLEDKLEGVKKVPSDNEADDTEEEEEEEEDIYNEEDKPRKRNPMIDDEAEESDIEECEKGNNKINANENAEFDVPESEVDNDDASDEDSSVEESSESEFETVTRPKKGRILKAFEDSDDENTSNEPDKELDVPILTVGKKDNPVQAQNHMVEKKYLPSQVIIESQDEDLQLAQRHKSFSDDLFTSQESMLHESTNVKHNKNENTDEPYLGTQTFSILNNDISEAAGAVLGNFQEKLNVISNTQPHDEVCLDAVVGMCSGSFSQNLVTSQFPSAPTQSQLIGEDILNLCTGQFYDNQFVSQMEKDTELNNKTPQSFNECAQICSIDDNSKKIGDVNSLNIDFEEQPLNIVGENEMTEDILIPKGVLEKRPLKIDENKKSEDRNVLESILKELNDPEFEAPKSNKYFVSAQNNNSQQQSNIQFKKKFIIDSDDETNATFEGTEKSKKRLKKKRPEKRALQISDDEDEEDKYSEAGSEELDISDMEEDDEKIVEYDSEENEVEVLPQKMKKRKLTEFLEQEAELTSEDEWMGSGDEDEAGLDRMEREAGDDDTFNQAQLQKELGQIHMRDVLDQDKREVRIIQELLFEDGDLGDGHRQRKFRWRNADGEEITGTVPDEFADTQEEEFESEEQWRKQRHEREVFLRQMQKQEDDDTGFNISVNRTSIIKANLSSRSSLLPDTNKMTTETETLAALAKTTAKDLPSPKKAFTVFKQNYHGSLLSRGGGALARLAALATPLAVDDDAPKIGTLAPSSKRNFVFAALTPEEKPKVAKRKAETNVGTPRLIKKMKIKDNQPSKTSLLDHLKA